MKNGLDWNGPLRSSTPSAPAMNRDNFNLHQTNIQSDLEHFHGWRASTAALGSLFQCLDTIMEKNVFLIFNLNLLSV